MLHKENLADSTDILSQIFSDVFVSKIKSTTKATLDLTSLLYIIILIHVHETKVTWNIQCGFLQIHLYICSYFSGYEIWILKLHIRCPKSL